ncbi:MAG: glycogen synthase [Candidatus Riflebacteria bacterium]|nr:glycogen synthase [Candidatus Riflebacteria bacterium]
MKALFLTNEYPPYTYGGAGVHVEYLTRELSRLMDVEVRSFGGDAGGNEHLTARGFPAREDDFKTAPKSLQGVFATLDRCLSFAGIGIDAQVVHCHTWYTHMAGIWARLNYHIPLVLTTHSLEPLRPWKREQLGHGYDFSSWVEKTAIEMADAIVAVSKDTKSDILKYFSVDPEKIKIIHNGIDTDEFHKKTESDCIGRFGFDPDKPYLLFVGRITRQKGIIHLVNALPKVDAGLQIVLCAGAPDTPEIAAEMKEDIERVSAIRPGITWIREMVDRKTLIQLYSHAALFCCPSIYEPFGIINLEAMACSVPVIGSAVGGIPEVVTDNETGLLVPLQQMKTTPFEPVDPSKFSDDLAAAINRLACNSGLRESMGKKGRERVEAHFSWRAIAEQTRDLYQSLLKEWDKK